MKISQRSFPLLFAVAGLFAFIAAAPAQISNTDCLECHGEVDAEPHVNGELFLRSVHADNECTSCHDDIADAMHDTPLKKVDCSECHDIESEIYLQSSHR